jgi:6-phospho-beta-glucosidase
MIVTILGGSAPSTGWLIDDLAGRGCAHTIRLAGRTPAHLAAVTRACRILAHGTSLKIEPFEFVEWARALDGADAVIIQIREGGLEGRWQDETFPKRYGIPGDEGLGPGGLSAAIRTWPVLRELLGLVQVRAPQSLKILLTSPAGLLIGASAHEFAQMPIYAICELPFTTLQSITRESVTFGYSGVNHLGWLHDIRRNGTPLIDKPVPLKYLRLHFQRAEALREAARAPLLMRIREQTYDAFGQGSITEIRSALALRSAPWYAGAVAPLLAGVTTQPYFLTQPGAVGERAYAWTGTRFLAMPSPPPSAFIRKFVDQFLEYEEQALPAVLHPTPARIDAALKAHPWTQSFTAKFRPLADFEAVVPTACHL